MKIIWAFLLIINVGCMPVLQQNQFSKNLTSNMDETVELYKSVKTYASNEYIEGRMPVDIWLKLKELDKKLVTAYELIKSTESAKKGRGVKTALQTLRASLPLINMYIQDKKIKAGISAFAGFLEYQNIISGGEK